MELVGIEPTSHKPSEDNGWHIYIDSTMLNAEQQLEEQQQQ